MTGLHNIKNQSLKIVLIFNIRHVLNKIIFGKRNL